MEVSLDKELATNFSSLDSNWLTTKQETDHFTGVLNPTRGSPTGDLKAIEQTFSSSHFREEEETRIRMQILRMLKSSEASDTGNFVKVSLFRMDQYISWAV